MRQPVHTLPVDGKSWRTTGVSGNYSTMSAYESTQEWNPAEPTLGEELAALRDEYIFEMANLHEEDTGIPGVVFISTVMGAHGPRVKYFVKAGRNQPSFSVSISDSPRVLASSLPVRELNRFAPSVLRWVELNKDQLLRFWNEGETWSHREVTAFIEALKKV